MLRIISALVILANATAIREELGEMASALLDVEVDQEMKLVPAKISRAIRRAMRMSADAMKVAEEQKENATQASAAAQEKSEEAQKQKGQAEKMLEELEQGKSRLEQMRVKAAKAAEEDNEVQEAWKEEERKLKVMVDELAEQDEAIAKLKMEMRALADKMMDLQAERFEKDTNKNEQEIVVQKKASDAAAAGGMKRAALEAQQKAAAAYEEAEGHCNEQELRAEEAEKDFKKAEADARMAQAMHDAAAEEVQARVAAKNMVVELREAVQAYYDEVDAMTKSMEALLAQSEADGSGKKAHELMREDPNVKSSMIVYNKMVGVFRRLFHEEREFFNLVAESNKEIQENAQAAILLQCDPLEDLEMEARETKNFENLNEKCGTGLWESLGLEMQEFPSAKDETHPPETPTATAMGEESPEETVTSALQQQDSAWPRDPALLQVRNLDLARQIRRFGRFGGFS